MKKLVCIVEGKGEVGAVPNLCMRILRQHLNDFEWVVDNAPIRHPRGKLVDEKKRSPQRTCQEEGLRRAIQLAKQTRKANAVLVLCDADDDCPATWGPDAARVVSSLSLGGAVMALREYETWLLLNYTDEQLAGAGAPEPERKRGAKEALARLVPSYLPTTHQLRETQKLDIARVRKRSDSFDKLVRVLASISGTTPPAR
ncbi:DUF4276 family protein [Archangium lipolyticum]|uniref:DUF4276 family protein n=1 Tax=Archangium lipolyticum TaxID=2970465 RepID=UPI002149B0BF|nr:DUF4276 family protein [Archangium lipolyticum]